MNDPYPYFTEHEVWKSYYEYFSSLCRHARDKTLNKREVSHLSHFAKYPASSAYDIAPGNKTNQRNYRYAKLALNKFRKLRLIKLTKLEKKKKNQRYPAKKYSLTDHGVFFLISHSKISRAESLQELFKNYPDLSIFQYLVYPYMNLRTICSPKFGLHFLAGIGKYLVNSIQRIDEIISRIEKINRSDREIYFWNYNKLEGYLKKSNHYEFIDYLNSEEDFDDRYQKISYFDEKNKDNYVTITYDKKSKKAYISRKNKRTRIHQIPFATEYMTRKVIPFKIDMASRFQTLCGPKVEEFVLSVFPFFKIVSEGNILELLTKDRPFKEAIKATKNRFDNWYKLIMSLSNPSF